MNLLFENWRKFLKEGAVATAIDLGIDIAHVKAIEETGLILNRYLGEGSYGKVYEVEDKKTGQRMAAKVVPTTSTGFASETQNYNWIIKNRDKLPNDVKQHLVDVYELIETPDRQYLIILMEQLTPHPEPLLIKFLLMIQNPNIPKRKKREFCRIQRQPMKLSIMFLKQTICLEI